MDPKILADLESRKREMEGPKEAPKKPVMFLDKEPEKQSNIIVNSDMVNLRNGVKS